MASRRDEDSIKYDDMLFWILEERQGLSRLLDPVLPITAFLAKNGIFYYHRTMCTVACTRCSELGVALPFFRMQLKVTHAECMALSSRRPSLECHGMFVRVGPDD